MAVMHSTVCLEFRACHQLTAGSHIEAVHGHHYRIEVTTQSGLNDPEFIYQWTRENVVAVLDRRNLAHQFKTSTGECLVEWIDTKLRQSPFGESVVGVFLQETLKNRFVSSRTESYLL